MQHTESQATMTSPTRETLVAQLREALVEARAELEANAAEIGRKDTMLIEAHDTLTEIYYGSMPPQRRNELTRELIAKFDAATTYRHT